MPAKWYLLIHEEGNVTPERECFEDEQALQERVLTLIGKPAWVHIFYGWCGCITAPPFRYLMLPGKEPFPLFSPPQVPQVQEDLFEGAYMGSWEDLDEWEDPELTAINDSAEGDEPDTENSEDEDEVPLDDVLEPEDEFFFDDEDGGAEQE